MKKFLLLLSCSLLIVFSADAQICTPDSAFINQGAGVYPDTSVDLPPAYTCQDYFEYTFTAVVPADTALYPGFVFSFVSIDVDTVTGLPPGFTLNCPFPDCSFPGLSLIHI